MQCAYNSTTILHSYSILNYRYNYNFLNNTYNKKFLTLKVFKDNLFEFKTDIVDREARKF